MIPLADTASNLTSILFWSFTCVVLLVVMMVLIAWLRRRLSPNEDFHGEGFTLADLRRMHKAGQMTDEEYERAKAKLIQGLGNVPEEK
jgi:uncharacterized membrane protein